MSTQKQQSCYLIILIFRVEGKHPLEYSVMCRLLLTHLLLDKVVNSGGDSRIVHVSSDAHLTKFDFEGGKSRIGLR